MADTSTTSPVRVHVSVDHRGGWEVALPDGRARIRCETLEEARRVALRFAARKRSCDLVVRDAYDRVLHHELIDDSTQ